ncbi:hypothetical protein Pelo_5008 [Pelomyxa schiedti]|nr:hypothetical protein Pelo_5008 [Pelomyxa schiedti]
MSSTTTTTAPAATVAATVTGTTGTAKRRRVVAVGTGSPLKIAAVGSVWGVGVGDAAAAAVDGGGDGGGGGGGVDVGVVQVEGCGDVRSGVPDQPVGAGETLAGALNRARGALRAHSDAEVAIGIESGMLLAVAPNSTRSIMREVDLIGTTINGDRVGQVIGTVGLLGGSYSLTEDNIAETWVDTACIVILTDRGKEMAVLWSDALVIPSECLLVSSPQKLWSPYKDPHKLLTEDKMPRGDFIAKTIKEWKKEH